MSESFVFRGNRDQFQEWYDAIKIKFNRNGVNRVTFNLATNYGGALDSMSATYFQREATALGSGRS